MKKISLHFPTSLRTKLGILIVFSATAILTIAGLTYEALQKTWASSTEAKFITVWNTGNDGKITIPLFNKNPNICGNVVSGSYQFEVDWGDGTTNTYYGGDTNPSHTYAHPNMERTISIKNPGFRGMTFHDSCTTAGYADVMLSAKKLLRVVDWGTIPKYASMHGMFKGAENLTSIPDYKPANMSEVTDFSYMFHGATNFDGYVNLNVSAAKTMAHMFNGAYNFSSSFHWDNTTQLTDTSYMFANTNKFNGLTRLITTNVTNMSYMFYNAKAFNNHNVRDLDVSNVTDFTHMFSGASAFNQPLS